MILALASDHAGFEYKNDISVWLKSMDYDVLDFGTNSTDSCDYPDYAFTAAESVSKNKAEFGIIICGTGTGMSIVANKVQGVRAANCITNEMAKLARSHNNANVLTLGARLISLQQAKEIITTFLNTTFDGGRHTNRVEKIHMITGC